jgi:hypothetical protein
MRHQAVILLLLAILPPLSASALASAPEILIFTKSGIGTIRADTVWEQGSQLCWERRGYQDCTPKDRVSLVPPAAEGATPDDDSRDDPGRRLSTLPGPNELAGSSAVTVGDVPSPPGAFDAPAYIPALGGWGYRRHLLPRAKHHPRHTQDENPPTGVPERKVAARHAEDRAKAEQRRAREEPRRAQRVVEPARQEQPRLRLAQGNAQPAQPRALQEPQGSRTHPGRYEFQGNTTRPPRGR